MGLGNILKELLDLHGITYMRWSLKAGWAIVKFAFSLAFH